jgi:N-acyl-D-glutamate deacylase
MGNRYEDTMLDPETNEYFTLETYKATIATNPTKPIVIFKQPEENIVKWLTLKGVTVASDATVATPYDAPWDYPLDSLGGTHPRTAGTRGKTIRIGRENNIPMMQLMSILSYNAAKNLGETGLTFFQERGRIQTGMVADIVVFDPETFTDNSTYENGAIPSTGMRAVIVNGQVTVRDDVLLPVFAGQPIRFEPEDKPRYEPVTVEKWNAEFTTGLPSDFDGCGHEGHKH